MKTLQITPEAAEYIRWNITSKIHADGLNFLYSPKADLAAAILDALQCAAEHQKPAPRRHFVVVDPVTRQVVGGGLRS